MLKKSGMSDGENKSWRFLSNHTQVLLCISRDPDVRLREIASKVGITERAAHRIVTDLVESGYLERLRVGRRNRYRVNPSIAMRHPAQHGQEVGALLGLLGVTEPRGEQTRRRAVEAAVAVASNHEARRPAQNGSKGTERHPAGRRNRPRIVLMTARTKEITDDPRSPCCSDPGLAQPLSSYMASTT